MILYSRLMSRRGYASSLAALLTFGLACAGLGAAWGAESRPASVLHAALPVAGPSLWPVNVLHPLNLLAVLLVGCALVWLARRLERARRDALRVQQLRRTLDGGLLTMGWSLEERGFEVPGHTERVVQLACALGEAMDLDPAQQEQLKQGAYLHDIGKLTLPDSLLGKTSGLTEDERAQERSHPERGFDIAARLPGLSRGALSVIRYHHERWDGQGYPARLEGTQIPLLARIFAVCDVYDFLTGEREGKVTWTPEAARMEISAQAGRQFDPEVVAAFLAMPAVAFAAASETAPRPAEPVAVPIETVLPSSPRLLN